MSKVAVVTGAAGFIAGEIIRQLLAKGYTVRGTVRSKERSSELLKAFPGLILFEADLLKQGSFDEVVRGATFVLHTASPVILGGAEDPQTTIVDPAVNGTQNVLSSVEKSLDTVKKVVVTSSLVAILESITGPDVVNQVWDESHWNTTANLKDSAYALSKVLAEKAAWEWYKGKEDKVKLVVVNPGFVLGGTYHSRSDGFSIETLIGFLSGATKQTGTLPISFPIVDNRNVAEAHIAAIENDNASGRYPVSSVESYSFLDLAKLLKKHFPQYPLPETQNGEVPPAGTYSHARAEKELGVKFYPLEDTLVWAATDFIDRGLVPKI